MRPFKSRLVSQIEERRTPDFDYKGYERAGSEAGVRTSCARIHHQQGQRRPGDRPRPARPARRVAGCRSPAMELGLLLLHHAQGSPRPDPETWKSLFEEEAKGTFFAVNSLAGDRADYQPRPAAGLLLAGEATQKGRKLFDDDAQGAQPRSDALLAEVANLLRGVGSNSEARSIGRRRIQESY